MKPHKHAELIKAWADGVEIEFWSSPDNKWYLTERPSWDAWKTYRIKPEEKKPVVRWLWAYRNESRWEQFYRFMTEEEATKILEYHKHKKLEYTRTEFEE